MGVRNHDVYPDIKDLLDIPQDEPIFIVRAQDQLFPAVVGAYSSLYIAALRAGSPQPGTSMSDEEWKFENEVDDVRELGRVWQKNNADKVKIPD